MADTKEAKFNRVSEVLFALLNTIGPNRVTHSLVAKSAKVSRAWIYKYIGSNRDDLIRFAIDHLGKKITDRDLQEKTENKEQLVENIVAGMARMFENTRNFPWFVPVYFKYRGTSFAPAASIAEVERAYVKRQALLFQKFFSYDERKALVAAEILTTFRMGLAFSWQQGDLKSKASEVEVTALVRHWINELFAR